MLHQALQPMTVQTMTAPNGGALTSALMSATLGLRGFHDSPFISIHPLGALAVQVIMWDKWLGILDNEGFSWLGGCAWVGYGTA
jgi:hypothetical protein